MKKNAVYHCSKKFEQIKPKANYPEKIGIFTPSSGLPKGNQMSATAARGTNKKYATDMDPPRAAGKR
jgi:hypothetical protein